MAEQAKVENEQLSEQEKAAKREAENLLRNQIVQLQKEIEAKVLNACPLMIVCYTSHLIFS